MNTIHSSTGQAWTNEDLIQQLDFAIEIGTELNRQLDSLDAELEERHLEDASA